MSSASTKARETRWGRLALLVLCGALFAPLEALAGHISLAWDPSPDPVAGYTVHWGTSPGNYTHSVDTTQTSHTIQGLTNGVTYYFVVTAFSPAGLHSSPTNEVSGLPRNQPPSIVNPGDQTAKAGAFTLPISASDPDGDSLTFSATGLPPGLTIDTATGTIVGTVSGGVYTITVTVGDGAATASATFALTVTANSSPTLQTPPDQNNDTDDAVSLQLAANDADGDPVTFSATGLPTGLALNASSGLITGTPATAGIYGVTVTASDGAASATASFTWVIVGLPALSHWKFDEGGGAATSDAAGPRTGTLTNGAAWRAGRSGSAVLLDGVDDYVAIPPLDATGPAMTIAAWIRSSSFTTGDQRFISKTTGTTTFWSLGINAAALRFNLMTGTSTTTLDGGTLQQNVWYHAVAAYDGAMMRLFLDGVEVASTAKTGPIATGASVPVSIGRNPAGSGSNYLQGAIDDLRVFAHALSAADVATLYADPVIPPVNQPPVITNPGNRTVRTGPFTLTISASDAEGDTLTFSASGLPPGLSINASTGTITGTVAAGMYPITVTVTDGTAQASAAFTLTVTPNNSPTLQAPPDQNNDTDDAVSLQLAASDPDGDALTFTALGLPGGLTINGSTGLITGTPTTPGTFPVTVSVSDGAASASRTFTWTVVAAPLSPPLSHWKFDEGSGTNATDAMGPRTGTLTNGAAWRAGRSGSAVLLDGVNDYVAIAPFDVSGSAMTVAAWIRNSSFATSDQRFISKSTGTTTNWSLGTSGSALRFRLTTGTSTTTLDGATLQQNVWYHAVATYDGAMMRLYLNGVEVASAAKTGPIATGASVPVSIGRNPAGSGSNYLQGAIDDLRVFARALSGADVTTLFTEQVIPPVNQPPAITNPGDRTLKTGPFTLTISASDPEGGPLTFSATGLPSSLSINASTGTIAGTVAAGTYNITVTVTDGTAQASAAFTVTVTANNSPTLQPPPDQNNDTDDSVSLQLVASDPDGDALTFTAVGLPPGLSVNGSTGLITGTPATPGTFPVTASVSDGAASASRTFTWTVVAASFPTPLSHWKFDDNTGTTADDFVGTRDGTLTNGPVWTAGRSGSAVMMDGVDDYVALPTFSVTGTALTISAWIRNTSFTSGIEQRFMSKGLGTTTGGAYWTLGTDGGTTPRLRFRLRTGTTTTMVTATSGTLPVNTWYHAAATYDGAMMRLYLNGIEVGASAKTGTLATSASIPVSIGRNPSETGTNFLRGAVDDLRIFTKALTAAEVTTLFNEPVLPPNHAPVVTNPGSRTIRPGPFSLTIAASDGDGDALTYSASGLPSTLSIGASTGTISGTVAAGTYDITVTVSDTRMQTTVTFTLTVLPNLGPVLQPPLPQGHRIGDAVTLQLVASDPDGDLLTFSAAGLPPGLTIDQTTGSITGVPTTVGTYSVTVGVTDGSLAVNQTFSWTIAAPPSSGSFTDDPLIPGVHVMRLVHITELRTRIDALRVARGVSSMSWSPLVAGSTVIRTSHIAELRSALTAVYAAMGRPAPTFTDDPLAAGTPIKAVHITELRAAVLALE